ncbi:MAG: MFS transporter [Candidatus Acidiferrales bacterium]
MANGEGALIDVREEIRNAPVGRYHIVLASLVSMIVFFEGYDTFNASYVLHYVMKPWHLDPGHAGFLVSSGLIGFMISSLSEGKLSDRYGRRVTVLGALWIATIFSLATATLANSFITFCVFRFFTGLGLGVLLPVGVTYMNEYAPRRLANTFSTWGWTLGFSAGGVLAGVIGVYLTPVAGWQALYYVASLSAVLAVICHVSLPESLQFSAVRGDMKGMTKALSRLNPSQAPRYNAAGVRFIFPEPSDRLASISLLLSERYRRTSLSVWIASFFVLFAIYGLTGWIPTAMMQRGETFATSFGFGALIQAMNFFGCLACCYVADRHGHAVWTVVTSWVIGGIAMGTLMIANNHVLNLLCVGASGFFILGAWGALSNFVARWYETEVRGTAVGMMLGAGRFGGILGPLATGVIQESVPGSKGLFFVIGLATLIAALAVSFAGRGPAGGMSADAMLT